MNQRLKRWESPRSEGRNDKGKGGSARQRQKRKQFQMLRNKLKSHKKGDSASAISFFCINSPKRGYTWAILQTSIGFCS
ncbi:MAG: hypothetical protein IM516_11535 [Pseudanabaena sp. M158S2SP1A06QC]|jgi:hypothetical protein|uniref:hypothetical protein n=1 Tax=Pseudanabaena mucicola TaxID=71190 RepID=UPI0025771A7D|nr:hypothetical protein [Pseudanabaena mucicola]MCA6589911.1 hypothetical protein [Pseudanabaena sp. M109S1SP1A06QC]MCA6596705.1 hypothetical protein [Pseudanabaena sp. M046S1SP1A06QC]MCA6605147.1 hypothetical protein [Pseudanabaena sp. M007S1SP1A06QC]MCA6612713.1 hypothetical protein [Pseudanabaena sp. M158S2SP1A06QC]MCA6616145.1 hypothetical protein [Pseudanabaena sp. M090S1SP1A06QC]MCA6622934.1 hypothetical protein [Pseudanabaena sp. M165S2SP1A06QC]MCE2975197.1 hypothetical protein [Pseud